MLRKNVGKHRQGRQERENALPRLMEMMQEPYYDGPTHELPITNPTPRPTVAIPRQRKPVDNKTFWRPGDQYIKD